MKEINKDTTLGDIVSEVPGAGEVLLEHGLHCIGCHAARHESLEMGAKAHGMTDSEIEKIVDKLNKKLEKEK